mgnify:CR=1 FL=1
MAIEKHTINEQQKTAIWAETANLQYFLSTSIEADTVGGVETRTKDIPSRSVRRYVGDPNPYNVPAVSGARYLYDPGRRGGSATPGKEMILDDGTERRSFTYVGSFVDVHAFILGDAKMDLALYSEGDGYSIKAAEAAAVKTR